MLFASPLWLIAFLPALGTVLWLLWGRRKRTAIPFLDLWRGPALQKPVKRGLQWPPAYVAIAIAAMLLGVLGACRPCVRGTRSPQPITIIIDGGMTMSAMTAAGRRLDVTTKRMVESLMNVLPGNTPVNLLAIPNGQKATVPGLETMPATILAVPGVVSGLPPSAVDTREAIIHAVRDRLENSPGLVLVLSDRALAIENPRLIQFPPQGEIENVGITKLAARNMPTPQVMVRVRNDSLRRSIPLRVKSGSREIRSDIDLPARGNEQNYFIDLPGLDVVIEATLEGKDDQPADDRAWLVREQAPSRIEPRGALPPEVRRMIDVYTRLRPSGKQAVPVVTNSADLPDGAGVVVEASTPIHLHGPATAVVDPVTANINWSTFPADVDSFGEMPKGWSPLVSMGDRIIVASRTEPDRRVWVGFDPSAWSASTDFVVFWANVFGWVSGGAERYENHPLAEYEQGWKPIAWNEAWTKGTTAEKNEGEIPIQSPAPQPGTWPGLYQSSGGTLRAFAPDETIPDPLATTTLDWRQRITAVTEPRPGAYDLTAVLLVLAVICLAAAAGTWKNSGLTPVSAVRTF